jgi:hypothetical protein
MIMGKVITGATMSLDGPPSSNAIPFHDDLHGRS